MLTCSCEAGRQTRSSFPVCHPEKLWMDLKVFTSAGDRLKDITDRLFKFYLHLAAPFYDLHIPHLSPNLHYPQLGYMGYSSLFREQDESCRDCVRERLTFHQSLFFPLTQKHHKQKKKTQKTPVYRMRGQIYSQSGSRVIWLDAFL